MGLMCNIFTSVIFYFHNLGQVHNFKQYNFSTGVVEAPYSSLLIYTDIMLF